MRISKNEGKKMPTVAANGAPESGDQIAHKGRRDHHRSRADHADRDRD